MKKFNLDQFKPKRRQINNANSWAKNVIKSMGYTTEDLLTELMPASKEMISTNAELVSNAIREMRNFRQGSRRLADNFNKSPLMSTARDAWANVKEDLKTGNINNRGRIERMGAKEFGFDDMDFDFGDGSDSFATDDSGDEMTNINVHASIDDDSDMVSAADRTTQAVISSTDSINTTNVAIANQKMVMDSKLADMLNSNMANINTNLVSLVSFNSENMSKFTAASMSYYDESLGILREMKELMASKFGGEGKNEEQEKRENVKNQMIQEVFGSSGGFNIGAYGNLLKKQFKSTLEGGLVTGQIMTVLSDPEALKLMAANPLSFVTDSLVRKVIPQMVQTTMRTLDTSIKEFIPALLMKIGGMSESANPFLANIGKIFGIQPSRTTSVDMAQYEKGPVAFDGQTKKAITDVIPTYLRKILAELSGKEEMHMDWKTGTFRKISDIKKDWDNEVNNALLSGVSDIKSDVSAKISSKIKLKDKKEEEALNKKLDELFIKMMNSRNFINLRKRNVDGIIKDDLADLMTWDNNTQKEVIRAALLSLDKSTQTRLVGSGKMKGLLERTNLFEEAQTNRDPNNIFSIYGDASGNGEYNVKEGSSFGKDKYKVSSTEYLRDIRKLLTHGIIVFPTDPIRLTSGNPYEHLDSMRSKASNEKKRNKKKDNGSPEPFTREQIQSAYNTSGQFKLNTLAELDTTVTEDQLVDEFKRMGTGNEPAEREENNTSVIGRMKARMRRLFNYPIVAFKNTVDKIDNLLYNVIFGGEDDDTKSFLGKMMLKAKSKYDEMFDWMKTKFFKPLAEFLYDGPNSLKAKFENSAFYKWLGEKKEVALTYLFGAKGADGVRNGEGLFSDVYKETKLMGLQIKHYIVGSAYTDPVTGREVAKNPDSVFGNFAQMMKGYTGELKKHLFGDKDSTDKGLIGNAASSIGEGFKSFGDALFGKVKDKDGNWKSQFEDFGKTIKARAPKALATGIAGIGVASALGLGGGLLPALFLPTGPVGGLLVGTALGFANQSERFKEMMFGKIDENTGERMGGYISKKTQDFFKEHKTGMIFGATTGLITGGGILGSIFGGPIAGAMMGAGLSMIKRSETFKQMMFGEEVDGKRMGGLVGKIRAGFDKVGGNKLGKMGAGAISGAAISLIGSKFGLMGSLLFGGGPLIGALLGAASGLALTSEKWKTALFGKFDEDKQIRTGGLFGKFINWTKMEIFGPLKLQFAQLRLDFKKWFENSIAFPFKLALSPIKKEFQYMTESVKEMMKKGWDMTLGALGRAFRDNVFKPLGDAIKKYFVSPIKFMLKNIMNVSLGITKFALSSPFRMLSFISDSLVRKHVRRGVKERRKEGWDTLLGRRSDLATGLFGRLGFFAKGYLDNETVQSARRRYAPYLDEHDDIRAENERRNKEFEEAQKELDKRKDQFNEFRRLAGLEDYSGKNKHLYDLRSPEDKLNDMLNKERTDAAKDTAKNTQDMANTSLQVHELIQKMNMGFQGLLLGNPLYVKQASEDSRLTDGNSNAQLVQSMARGSSSRRTDDTVLSDDTEAMREAHAKAREKQKEISDKEARDALQALDQRTKSRTADARIEQINSQEERERELSFKEKMLLALQTTADNVKKHTQNWWSMFGKNGLIAMGILALVPLAKGIISSIANNIGGIIDNIKEFGSNIINTFTGGLADLPKNIWQTFKDFFTDEKDRKDVNDEVIENQNVTDVNGSATKFMRVLLHNKIKNLKLSDIGKGIKGLGKKMNKFLGIDKRLGIPQIKKAGGAVADALGNNKLVKGIKSKIATHQIAATLNKGAVDTGELVSRSTKGLGYADDVIEGMAKNVDDMAKGPMAKIVSKVFNTIKDVPKNIGKFISGRIGKVKANKVVKWLTTTLSKVGNKLLTGPKKLLARIAPKFSKALAKDGSKVITGGVLGLIFAAYDGISGMVEVRRIFRLPNDYPVTGTMRLVAGIVKALSNISAVIGILIDLAEEFLKIPIRRNIAMGVLQLLSAEDAAEAEKGYIQFKSDLDAYNKEHGTNLGENAWNDKNNKTLFKTVMDSKVAKAVGSGLAKIKQGFWGDTGFGFSDEDVRKRLGLGPNEKVSFGQRLASMGATALKLLPTPLSMVKTETIAKAISYGQMKLQKGIRWAWESATWLYKAFGEKMRDLGKGLKDGLAWLKDKAKGIIGGIAGSLDTFIGGMIGAPRDPKDGKQKISQYEWFKTANKAVSGAFQKLGEGLGNLGATISKFVDEKVKPMWDNLMKTIGFDEDSVNVRDNARKAEERAWNLANSLKGKDEQQQRKILRDFVRSIPVNEREMIFLDDEIQKRNPEIDKLYQKMQKEDNEWRLKNHKSKEALAKMSETERNTYEANVRANVNFYNDADNVTRSVSEMGSYSKLGYKMKELAQGKVKPNNTISKEVDLYRDPSGGESYDYSYDPYADDGLDMIEEEFSEEGYGFGAGDGYFSQNDPRWKNKKVGAGTMGDLGCGPTSMAMVANKLGINTNPAQLQTMANASGLSDERGTHANFMNQSASMMGLNTNQVLYPDKDSLRNAVNGGPTILLGNNLGGNSPYTDKGHYVVAEGMSGDKVKIQDPRGRGYNKTISINDLAGTTSAWSFTGSGPSLLKSLSRRRNVFYGRGSTAGEKVAQTLRSIEGTLHTYTQDPKMRLKIEQGYGDCSSTVWWAYKKALGIAIAPQMGGTQEQLTTGKLVIDCKKVEPGVVFKDPKVLELLKPGDLIFYGHSRSGYAKGGKNPGGRHVEMYLGGGMISGQGWGGGKGPKTKPITTSIGASYPVMEVRRYVDDSGKPLTNDVNIVGTGVEYNPRASASFSPKSGKKGFDPFSELARLTSRISNRILGIEEESGDGGSDAGTDIGSASSLGNTFPADGNSTIGSTSRELSDVKKRKLTDFKPITAKEINDYMETKVKANSKNAASPFRNRGQMFIDAGKATGLDPRYIFAHAAWESAYGLSSMSKDKHNYFGIAAFNDNPNAAYRMGTTPQEGVMAGASWIRKHYTDKGNDSLYKMIYNTNPGAYAVDNNKKPSESWMQGVASIMAPMIGSGEGIDGNELAKFSKNHIEPNFNGFEGNAADKSFDNPPNYSDSQSYRDISKYGNSLRGSGDDDYQTQRQISNVSGEVTNLSNDMNNFKVYFNESLTLMREIADNTREGSDSLKRIVDQNGNTINIVKDNNKTKKATFHQSNEQIESPNNREKAYKNAKVLASGQLIYS